MRFLLVDRIVELVPGEMVRGIKHVNRDDVYLAKDEAGRFCFAPSFIGEALGQLAAWNVMFCNDFQTRPVAGLVSSAKLHRPAFLGDTLLLESFIDSLDEDAVQYHSVARVGTDIVFTVDGALGPLLPMEQFIAEKDVRAQFAEINRPGDWSQYSQFSQNSQAACADVGAELSFPGPAYHVPMAFDRILEHTPGKSLSAEKRISRSAPYFPDHFPLKPVLPMTVLLECQRELVGVFLKDAGLPGPFAIVEFRKIKMNDFVFPGDILHCHLSVLQRSDDEMVLRTRSEVDGRRVCVVDMVMKANTVIGSNDE